MKNYILLFSICSIFFISNKMNAQGTLSDLVKKNSVDYPQPKTHIDIEETIAEYKMIGKEKGFKLIYDKPFYSKCLSTDIIADYKRQGMLAVFIIKREHVIPKFGMPKFPSITFYKYNSMNKTELFSNYPKKTDIGVDNPKYKVYSRSFSFSSNYQKIKMSYCHGNYFNLLVFAKKK